MEDDKFLALKVIKTESKEGSPSFSPLIKNTFLEITLIKITLIKMTLQK